jgi:hypothetical protein
MLAVLLPLIALGWAIVWPQLRLPAALSAAQAKMLGPVVTVTEVEHALARDPAGWSGRIVRVRGRAARYVSWQAPDSLVTHLVLVDPAPAPSTQPLAIVWGRPDPVLAALRQVPLVGAVVPPPQHLQPGSTAVYRVQVLAPTGRASAGGSVVLLDAEPDPR